MSFASLAGLPDRALDYSTAMERAWYSTKSQTDASPVYEYRGDLPESEMDYRVWSLGYDGALDLQESVHGVPEHEYGCRDGCCVSLNAALNADTWDSAEVFDHLLR